MVTLVGALRDRGRAIKPGFLVVAQNATDLRDRPGYLALLDGEAQEQVFFDGSADVSGADPRQGDCRLPLRRGDPPPANNPSHCAGLRTMGVSSEEYVRGLADFLAAGVPVLVVDYALRPENAAWAYAQHQFFRFVGLVTMRSLEDLTATPPGF
jgi:endo-alpha-1,4-polygalactosaminidase (GH114 family)